MESNEDAAILKKIVEKDRAYRFMAGFNEEYD